MSANRFIEDFEDFMKTFRNRKRKAIESSLNQHPLILSWLSSREVNFGTDNQIDMRKISFKKLISSFKNILASEMFFLIKTFWDNNPLLHDYYRGQEVNFGTEESPDIRQASLSTIVEDFESVLASQTPYIIEAIWNSNSSLQQYFSGQPVNGDVISFARLIDNFRSALKGHCAPVIMTIWNSNPLLRNYYSGQEINFGTHAEPNKRNISFDELDESFKIALSSQCHPISLSMWFNSSFLQEYYTGKPVNVGPKIGTISSEEMLNNFKSVLSSHCTELIEIIRNENSCFWESFSGRKLTFLDPISCNQLISNFKSVLSTHFQPLIKDIWNNNQVLYQAIRSLKEDESKLLLKKVMCSQSGGNSSFILSYLQWFDNTKIMQEVLDEIKSCKSSSYRNNQISLLEKRLGITLVPTVSKKRQTSSSTKLNKQSKTKKQKIVPALENVYENPLLLFSSPVSSPSDFSFLNGFDDEIEKYFTPTQLTGKL